VAITARQLESLVRLAEARAKAHLRTEVTKEDAEAVITLMQSSLEQVGIDVSTGQIDIDILYTGKPRSLQTQLQKVLGKIAELERTGPVKDDDLYEALAEDGVNRSEAAKLISTLMRDGTIFSPRPGTYRRTS
jgi:replicative DNA helicase Mcm